MSKGARVGKLTLPSLDRDKAATFTGVSGCTLEKIAAVCESAEAEPNRFARVVADMDRTGRALVPRCALT